MKGKKCEFVNIAIKFDLNIKWSLTLCLTF